MMMRETTEIKQMLRNAENFIGKRVTVAGWVRNIRVSRTFGFIELNDGSFFQNLQIVFDDTLDNFENVTKLGINTALYITGSIVVSQGAGQKIELQAEEILLEGACPSDYPLQKKRHSFEYLRTIAHLRPRTNTFSAVFRLRSVLAYAIHQYFQERGFVYVNTPIITASDCEGAGELFQLTTLPLEEVPYCADGHVAYDMDFFGKPAYLTVSGQLNAEAFAMAFGNVYTFGPTFRAENSNTARHAAEFWMLEPEIAFADLEQNMELAEDMMKHLIRTALEQLPEEMAFFNQFVDHDLLERLQHIVASDFGRVTYTEAIAILEDAVKTKKVEFQYPVEWGIDLQTEHERYLTDQHFKKPIFVTDYPKEIKAFYMRLNDDGKTVAAMDLLVPGIGEIIGGSQREERLDVLLQRMQELDMNTEEYRWYLELRKYGGTHHAGFGLGFERLLMYVSGMSNIRDVIAFPRVSNSAEF